MTHIVKSIKDVEHWTKYFLIRVFGRFIKRERKGDKVIDGDKVQSVLFLRHDKLGDAVVSFPVFDSLKKRYPHIKIYLLASRRNEAILKGDPRFEKIFVYSKNIFKDILELRRVRRHKFDCVIDMICNDSVTSLFLFQICAPKAPRVGVGKDRFREYYDYCYDLKSGEGEHMIDNTLMLLKAFGVDGQEANVYAAPFIGAKEDARGQDFMESAFGRGDGFLKVGLNLSAGSKSRYWPDEKVVALLKRIGECDPTTRAILITTPDDYERGKKFRERFPGFVFQIPYGLNIKEVAAIIRRLDLLISPDTSLVHVARSFGIPVVGLFSRHRRNYVHWHPYGQRDGAILSDSEENIEGIEVERVWEVFLKYSRKKITDKSV